MEQHETLRRAALDRFGLKPEEKDYTLQRVLRVAALALKCRFAAFSIIAEGKQHYVSVFGADWDVVDAENSICHAVGKSGEALWADDLSSMVEWKDHPAVAGEGGARAYVGHPVYASTRVVVGTLCVLSDEPLEITTEDNRLIINDCVRLIEDALVMRRHAIRDKLTGLFNRRYFDDQIDAEWRRAMRMELPITMLMIDIDHFKSLNDTMGHMVGDNAIREVAERLTSVFGRAGDILCRFGGEEFAVILPTTNSENALIVAERARVAVEAAEIEHLGRPDGRSTLTVSVGISTVNSRADLLSHSASDVLALADDALYQAKLAGRNSVRVVEVESGSTEIPADMRRKGTG